MYNVEALQDICCILYRSKCVTIVLQSEDHALPSIVRGSNHTPKAYHVSGDFGKLRSARLSKPPFQLLEAAAAFAAS